MAYFNVRPDIEEVLPGKKVIRTYSAEGGEPLTFKKLVKLITHALFSVWTEQDDPTSYYYPGLKSHMDHDLLTVQVSRRKVLGLFLILNFLNIINLLIP